MAGYGQAGGFSNVFAANEPIKPFDYNKASGERVGVPKLSDTMPIEKEAFNNMLTEAPEYDAVMKMREELVNKAIQAQSLGIDVTNPGRDPDARAYAIEWQRMYNDALTLANKLKEQRKFVETAYLPNVGDENKAVATPTSYDLRGIVGSIAPTTPLKATQQAYDELQQFVDPAQVEAYNQTLAQAQQGMTAYGQQFENPELAQKVGQQADILKQAMIPSIVDKDAIEKNRIALMNARKPSGGSGTPTVPMVNPVEEYDNLLNSGNYDIAVRYLKPTAVIDYNKGVGQQQAMKVALPIVHKIVSSDGNKTPVGALATNDPALMERWMKGELFIGKDNKLYDKQKRSEITPTKDSAYKIYYDQELRGMYSTVGEIYKQTNTTPSSGSFRTEIKKGSDKTNDPVISNPAPAPAKSKDISGKTFTSSSGITFTVK